MLLSVILVSISQVLLAVNWFAFNTRFKEVERKVDIMLHKIPQAGYRKYNSANRDQGVQSVSVLTTESPAVSNECEHYWTPWELKDKTGDSEILRRECTGCYLPQLVKVSPQGTINTII